MEQTQHKKFPPLSRAPKRARTRAMNRTILKVVFTAQYRRKAWLTFWGEAVHTFATKNATFEAHRW